MPRLDPNLVLTLASATSAAVGAATRRLEEHGFTVAQEPRFGPDSGYASLTKGDVEVSLNWFLEAGMTVSCRNRHFEKEKNDIVDLLRGLRDT
jgi:hypothetical protein